MNVIQHNTVTVSCTSRDVIHCRKTAAEKIDKKDKYIQNDEM